MYTSTGSILAIPGTTIVNPSQDQIQKADDYRIFQYPSKENFGKLNDNFRVESFEFEF